MTKVKDTDQKPCTLRLREHKKQTKTKHVFCGIWTSVIMVVLLCITDTFRKLRVELNRFLVPYTEPPERNVAESEMNVAASFPFLWSIWKILRWLSFFEHRPSISSPEVLWFTGNRIYGVKIALLVKDIGLHGHNSVLYWFLNGQEHLFILLKYNVPATSLFIYVALLSVTPPI